MWFFAYDALTVLFVVLDAAVKIAFVLMIVGILVRWIVRRELRSFSERIDELDERVKRKHLDSN